MYLPRVQWCSVSEISISLGPSFEIFAEFSEYFKVYDTAGLEEDTLLDEIYSEVSWVLAISVNVKILRQHCSPVDLATDMYCSRQIFVISHEVMRQYYCPEVLIDRICSKQAAIA